jgi:hypothetical protein
MGNLTLNGSSSGQITISPPAVAGTNTLTLPAVTDTVTTNAASQTLSNKTLSSPTVTTGINLSGSSSGTTILAPSAAASGTITLPAGTGTVAVQGVSTNLVLGSVAATTSGTSFSFTGLPSYIRRITFSFNQVGTSGTSNTIVQMGTSGGFITSGYISTIAQAASSFNGTSNVAGSGFVVQNMATASRPLSGQLVITLIDPTNNIWAYTSTVVWGNSNWIVWAAGSVTLSGTLTQVKLTTANGTDSFNSGSVNILYE